MSARKNFKEASANFSRGRNSKFSRGSSEELTLTVMATAKTTNVVKQSTDFSQMMFDQKLLNPPNLLHRNLKLKTPFDLKRHS